VAPKSDGTPGLRFIEKDRDVVRIGKTLVGVKTDLTGTINNWPGYERYLKKLEEAQYVLVVRSEDVRLPIKFSTSFTPGTVRSSAVLFEIATAKPLGRIAIDARSDDKMIAQNVDGHLGAEAQYQSRLEADLGAKWGKAVADAVGKKWPEAPDTRQGQRALFARAHEYEVSASASTRHGFGNHAKRPSPIHTKPS